MATNRNFEVWRAAEPEPVAARIAISGDFLPAGNQTMASNPDWRERASALHAHFEDVDESFVNLEASLNTEGLKARTLLGLGQIVSAHAASLEYLKAIQCHVIGIANNHSYDFGDEGTARTRAAIAHHGMVPLGAGSTLAKRPEILIWDGPEAVRVGFWASAKTTVDAARQNIRGVEPADPPRGNQALEEMKSRGATFCVALVHAGCMRTNRPDPEDVNLMETLAHSGFDLIAASHSHRIAGYKQISHKQNRNGFCFFGLGSLVSGYSSSPIEGEGLVVVATLGAKGNLISLEVRAVQLDADGFGSIADDTNNMVILGRFRSLSNEMSDGSYKKHFYREISQGLGRLYFRDAKAALRSAGIRGVVRKAARVRMRHLRRLIHGTTA